MPCLNLLDCLRRRPRLGPCCVALLLACIPHGACRAVPKTDVVVLKNGDPLTGEVKRLDRGQLSFDTYATGTISIEWARLASVRSNQILQIELIDGQRHVGQAPEASEAGKLRLVAPGEGAGRESIWPKSSASMRSTRAV